MEVSMKSPIIIASRGARFLDLVRQNKLNVSPQLTKVKSIAKEEKNYLKLSAKKFDPDASPTSSILSKRKAEPDSSPLTSSAKRKRVGFRDPVSSTKEYLISYEEERQKQASLIRCLRYENTIDDEELNKIQIQREIKEEPKEPTPLEDHDYNDHTASPQNTDISTSSGNCVLASSNDGSEKLTFKDKNELMNYISKNLSVDEIFEKLTQAEKESLKRKELISRVVTTVGLKNLLGEYFSVPANQTNNLSAEQNEAITIFLAEITSLMKTNSSVKHKVLDVLSEQHPKEFLSHALQENSTTRVCDEITVPKIANYLVHKVNVSDENEEEINLMQRSMLQKLIANTSCSERKIVADHEETQEMMKLLFKNKAKIDIFDDVHEFLRNLVQPD